jgi:hypothetical protein
MVLGGGVVRGLTHVPKAFPCHSRHLVSNWQPPYLVVVGHLCSRSQSSCQRAPIVGPEPSFTDVKGTGSTSQVNGGDMEGSWLRLSFKDSFLWATVRFLDGRWDHIGGSSRLTESPCGEPSSRTTQISPPDQVKTRLCCYDIAFDSV